MASNKPVAKSQKPVKASKNPNPNKASASSSSSKKNSPNKKPSESSASKNASNRADPSKKPAVSAAKNKALAKGSSAKSAPSNKPLAKPLSVLAVIVDGAFLEDDRARSLWMEFSAYMDVHQNDFDGFAKSKGFAKVLPEHRQGRAVLVITNN